MQMNINEKVFVQLTPEGQAVLEKHYKQVLEETKPILLQDTEQNRLQKISQPDRNGYHVFQMHNLMKIFGPHLIAGRPDIFVDSIIHFNYPFV